MCFMLFEISALKYMLYEEIKGKKYGFHFFLASHSTKAKIYYNRDILKRISQE